MRYLLLFIILLSTASCRRYVDQMDFIDTDEVTRQAVLFSHEMKAEHHLHLENAYYCFNRDDLLTTLYLEYWTQDQFEICKARYIIVDIVEGILKRINENNLLRDARANLPFDIYNLEIVVHSTTFYGRFDDILLTEWICMKNGIVSYYAFDANVNRPELLNHESDFYHRHQEEYGTTLANVSAEIEATVPYYDKFRQAPGKLRTKMNVAPTPRLFTPITPPEPTVYP